MNKDVGTIGWVRTPTEEQIAYLERRGVAAASIHLCRCGVSVAPPSETEAAAAAVGASSAMAGSVDARRRRRVDGGSFSSFGYGSLPSSPSDSKSKAVRAKGVGSS